VDRNDIVHLASAGLIKAGALRKRAEEALAGYVGDLARIRGSLDIACRLADSGRHERG
jgi:hypothetical protein